MAPKAKARHVSPGPKQRPGPGQRGRDVTKETKDATFAPEGGAFPGTGGPAEEKLKGLGWAYGQNGQLRSVGTGELYSIETFEGDYAELADAMSDYVVEAMQHPPWHLKRLPLKDISEDVSKHVFASDGALTQSGPLLVLIPGIGCRAGVWSRSLCATHSLGFGGMFEFLRIAGNAGIAQIILDPNDSTYIDGMLHTRHCVEAWLEIIEKASASELFIVAHSYGGASLVDILAVASANALARIRGIAFTDSVHFLGKECLQLREGGLPPAACDVLRKYAVHWQADDQPLDTQLHAFNDDRGCRCVSAGVNEHASTNAFGCCSIFRYFASNAPGTFQPLHRDLESVERDIQMAAALGSKEVADEVSIQKSFQEWDVDKNGTISFEDLTQVLHLLNPGIPSESLAAVFKRMDFNGDGVVDYEEFVSWMFKPTASLYPPGGKSKSQGSNDSKAMRHSVNVEAAYKLSGNAKLFVSSGNIVKFSGDAIVNAANRGCVGGGGVDKAIASAGGPVLLKARKELPFVTGSSTTRCPVGEARITVGGNLPARFCIHAVGPSYTRSASVAQLEEMDGLLTSAYRSAMACAAEQKLKHIAFCLLSAGIFKGPRSLERVLELGVAGIQAGSYEGLEEVHMMGFEPEELRALRSVCGAALTSENE
jgi:O-acetyl-ADP-ribose deacetylase (regulator of RNase III)/pimeloyl-ACP methyl ester carboxylesterase